MNENSREVDGAQSGFLGGLLLVGTRYMTIRPDNDPYTWLSSIGIVVGTTLLGSAIGAIIDSYRTRRQRRIYEEENRK